MAAAQTNKKTTPTAAAPTAANTPSTPNLVLPDQTKPVEKPVEKPTQAAAAAAPVVASATGDLEGAPDVPVGGHSSIGRAIHAVMMDVDYVQKKKHSDQLPYKFASESDVIAKLRPVLLRHGLVMYPVEDSLTTDTFTTARGAAMNRVICKTVWRLEHVTTGEYRDIPMHGEAMDQGDKATNKAHTASGKYALLKTFMIETGADPDYEPSEQQVRKTPGGQGSSGGTANRSTPPANQANSQAANPPTKTLEEQFDMARQAVAAAETVARLDELAEKFKQRKFSPNQMSTLELAMKKRRDVIAPTPVTQESAPVDEDIPF